MSEAGRRLLGPAPGRVLRALGVVTAAGVVWIVGHFAFPPTVVLPASCPEPALLAHRSNSVSAAVAAARRGFCGLEVDIQWRDGIGMVVDHDQLPPTWTLAGSLTLPGLLDSLPEPPALLWLDFKNLSRRNALDAASYLDTVVARRGLQRRVIVESRSPGALWTLYRRVGTILPAYWIPPRPVGVRAAVYDTKLALVLGALALPALSVPQKQLTPQFARRFQRFALFTWTCNSPEEVRAATSLGARVILTDEDPPGPRPGSQAASLTR